MSIRLLNRATQVSTIVPGCTRADQHAFINDTIQCIGFTSHALLRGELLSVPELDQTVCPEQIQESKIKMYYKNVFRTKQLFQSRPVSRETAELHVFKPNHRYSHSRKIQIQERKEADSEGCTSMFS